MTSSTMVETERAAARRSCRLLLGAMAILQLLAACASSPRVVELAPLTACPVVDSGLWRAGELPDGLPADPGEAVLALGRAWRERGAALEELRRLLEAPR